MGEKTWNCLKQTLDTLHKNVLFCAVFLYKSVKIPEKGKKDLTSPGDNDILVSVSAYRNDDAHHFDE